MSTLFLIFGIITILFYFSKAFFEKKYLDNTLEHYNIIYEIIAILCDIITVIWFVWQIFLATNANTAVVLTSYMCYAITSFIGAKKLGYTAYNILLMLSCCGLLYGYYNYSF